MSTQTTIKIEDVKAAKELIAFVKASITRDGTEQLKYKAYVEAENVTLENVGAHVKALRLMAYPDLPASDKAAKNLADRIRAGLRYHLDTPSKKKSTNLLTPLGVERLKGLTDDEVLKLVKDEMKARVDA